MTAHSATPLSKPAVTFEAVVLVVAARVLS